MLHKQIILIVGYLWSSITINRPGVSTRLGERQRTRAQQELSRQGLQETRAYRLDGRQRHVHDYISAKSG